LKEALDELAKDRVIFDAIGEHIWERFREAKSLEWDNYRTSVFQWEVDRYLAYF
jgi:glutamine synthetase